MIQVIGDLSVPPSPAGLEQPPTTVPGCARDVSGSTQGVGVGGEWSRSECLISAYRSGRGGPYRALCAASASCQQGVPTMAGPTRRKEWMCE